MIAPGTPIAVVAPSGAYDAARLAAGIDLLRERGHDPRPLPGLDAQWRYLAGDDDHRAAQLVHALTSEDYGAVWIARGGYGLTRILDRLPLDTLPQRPVIGFSDVTALFCALDRAGCGPLIHGPVVHSLGITDDDSTTHLFDLLEGRPLEPLTGQSWSEGTASGRLVGGNICVLAATCGTPWQLDATGAILVLEEVGEPAYRLDRLLQQLDSCGVFSGVRGFAVGQMHHCRVPEAVPYRIEDVLADHLCRRGVPVVGDLPIGHAQANRAFPWGVQAQIAGGKLSW
jgi:muramoyltetrapeptide carboxypeptidase